MTRTYPIGGQKYGSYAQQVGSHVDSVVKN